MSNSFLNSDTFWEKIYDRFPQKYRADDEKLNFPLRKYIQAAGEGGFKYAIDEINGLPDLLDPFNTTEEGLLVLFQYYGLPLFHGIPVTYLRYLLPRLSEAWQKKGSLESIEFVVSSLSGIRTSTTVHYGADNLPQVDVRLEMDFNMGEYFPDAAQFNRILDKFVPFYIDKTLIYVYVFYESQRLYTKEYAFDEIHNYVIEQAFIPYDKGERLVPTLNILDYTLSNNFECNATKVFTVDPDVLIDLVKGVYSDLQQLYPTEVYFDSVTDVSTPEESLVNGTDAVLTAHVFIDHDWYYPALNNENFVLNDNFLTNLSGMDYNELEADDETLSTYRHTDSDSVGFEFSTELDTYMGFFTNVQESVLNDGHIQIPDTSDAITHGGNHIRAYPSLKVYVGAP